MAAADDFASNTTTTGRLQPGGQTSATFEAAYDGDWFRVPLVAGNYYTFQLNGGADLAARYTNLSFFKPDGSYFRSNDIIYSGSTLTLSIKAEATGDYYVGAADRNSNPIAPIGYTLKASAAIVDDVGDTIATAKPLAAGKVATGVFDGFEDRDCYKVTLQAGVTYQVDSTWNVNGTSTDTFYLWSAMQDAAGNAVKTSFNSNGDFTFTADRAGDYYLLAGSRSLTSSAYSLVINARPDDHTASVAGAGVLAVGAPAAGQLELARDRDWYAVSLNAGTTYWFTMGSAGGTGNFSGYGEVKVMDASGNVLAMTPSYSYVSGERGLVLSYAAPASGLYYVEAGSSEDTTGRYTIGVAVGQPDDHGDDGSAATALRPGTPIAGRLEVARDVDMFRLPATAGVTYTIELNAENTAAGAGLKVFGASNTAQDYLSAYKKPGATDYYTYTAATTGDYYMSVYNYSTGSPASYTLKVAQPGNDDYLPSRATTGALQVGGKIAGAIDYTGDVDWIKVTLPEAGWYAFNLRSEGSLAVGEWETDLTLHGGAASDTQYYRLNGPGGGIYTFQAQAAGDYYLAVRPYNGYAGAGATGGYTLDAVSLIGDTAGPVVKAFSAAQGAGLYDNLTITFDETVYSISPRMTLRDSLGAEIESYYPSWNGALTVLGPAVTANPKAPLKPGTSYLLELSFSHLTDLVGNKYTGGTMFSFSTAPAVPVGGDGNDLLTGLGNGGELAGGAGVDTAVYGFARGAYTITRGGDATEVLNKNWSGAPSGDTLTGIERLLFTDTNVALDIGGNGGQAYRLYQAAFDRAPDKAGVGYWIAQLDKGAALLDVARGFLDSAEFTTLYGAAPGNGVFVDKLYANVLHRAPDQGGVDYWLGVLNQGGDRAEVLAAFSESPENQTAVLRVIGNGFDYTPHG